MDEEVAAVGGDDGVQLVNSEDDHHQRVRGNFLLESFGRSPGVPCGLSARNAS